VKNLDATTGGQIITFISTLISGMLSSLLLHLYILGIPKKNRILKESTGLIIWFLCSIITFVIIFLTNWGELRGYQFLGFLLGCGIYYITIRRLLLKVRALIRSIFKKILNKKPRHKNI
jgi:spore cortex biosynthesis protein YabQ